VKPQTHPNELLNTPYHPDLTGDITFNTWDIMGKIGRQWVKVD